MKFRFSSFCLVLTALSATACAGEVASSEDTAQSDDAIIGGHPAWDHPEVGQIELLNPVECTATLIGPRTILTAAHCFNYASQEASKRAGVFFITKLGDDYPNQHVTYEYFIMRYVSLVHTAGYTGKNDLAVAQLDRDVPASVATPYHVGTHYPVAGADTAIYGYGAHTPTGQPVGITSKYRRDFRWHTTGEAGFNYIDDVTGHGDSGGPVMTAATGIVGVVSGDYQHPPYQDVFGNAVLNYNWIHTWSVRWT